MISCTAIAVAALALSGDLVRNGGAEDGSGQRPEHWGTTGDTATATFEWAEREGGGRALVIRSGDPRDERIHNWRQQIPLPERRPEGTRARGERGERPARLALAARVRAQDLHVSARICVMVQQWGADGNMVGGAWSDYVTSDTDWRDVGTVFDVEDTCVSLQILAFLIGEGVAWFDDVSLAPSDAEPRSATVADSASPLETLAREAASEIGWLFDVDAAKERARDTKRPILVYVRCIDARDDQDATLAAAQRELAAPGTPFGDDGFRKDLLMRAGPLSDADVVELVRTRYVPLLVTYHLGAHGQHESPDDPLRAVGARAHEITTPALLVLDARGKLVHALHRIGTMSAPFVDRVLRAALEEARAKAPDERDDAAALFAAGELAETLDRLAGRFDAKSRVLRARAHQRLGDLDAADQALGDGSGPDVELQRGLVALARGDWAQADERLGALELPGDHPRAEEARFWAAWAALRLGRADEAWSAFHEIVGPTRVGRRAALCVQPSGPRLPLALSVIDAGAELPRELPDETEGLVAEDELDAAAAVRFLLEQQRAGGSWGGHDGVDGEGHWEPAITGIAGDALLAWRAPLADALGARIDAALARADTYLAAWSSRPPNGATGAFNHPYALDYLLRRGTSDAREAAQRVVALIERTQQADDNWTVYVPDRPASFNTALNVRSLARARAAGLRVSDDVLASGAAALEAMRTKKGLFPYSTKEGHEWMTTEHGSIARDALCESALALAGRDTTKHVRSALDRFVDHCEELRAPTKKYYDWFNSRGHGGYYFFFAYRNALEASEPLPPAKRKRLLATIEGDVLRVRELDGTWMDHALLGRAYATAMALCILAPEKP